MTPEFEIDLREFSKTLDAALLESSRELSEALNARMYFLLSKAEKNTKRADEQTIRKLGLYSFQYYKKPNKKTGISELAKKPKSRLQVDAAIANLIGRAKSGNDFRARLYLPTGRGQDAKNRSELVGNARGWVAGKLKAIGFLASLWIPAIRRFDKFAAQKSAASGQIKKTSNQNVKGIARPARPGLSPIAEGGFMVGVNKGNEALRPYAQKLLHDAMGAALRQETAEMKRHLEEKLKKSLRSSGVEVRG